MSNILKICVIDQKVKSSFMYCGKFFIFSTMLAYGVFMTKKVSDHRDNLGV